MTIEFINDCIEKAKQHKSKLNLNILTEVRGLTSPKVCHLLNNLVGIKDDINYLEIGVYQGKTFCAATSNNKGKAIAIDNFSQYGDNLDIFTHNTKTYCTMDSQFYNMDCFEFTTNEKFDIYFYDGNHSHENQQKAMEYFWSMLKDTCIVIVDDWNHEPARTGTIAGIKNVVKSWQLPAAYNGDSKQWWNGLYVALIDKNYSVSL